MSWLNTAPVAAQVYGWQAGDTITPTGTGDAGGEFALANIIGENVGPVMFRQGRTTTAGDAQGFVFELVDQIELVAMELANTAAVSGEDVTWEADDATTFVSGDQITTAAWPQTPGDIWTGYTGLQRSRPVRSNILIGYDNFTIGPGPPAPAEVQSVDCGSGRILFSTAGGSRTFWEASYLALGINGRTLPSITQNQLSVTPVRLKNPGGGKGYRYSIAWPHLPEEDAVFLNGLWDVSEEGTFPVFLFPHAGQRDESTGTISGLEASPDIRGGLVRLISWKRKVNIVFAKAPDSNTSSATLVAETWQEVPTSR